MSFQNIPVFVVFHRDENDDDASVVSFATGSSYSHQSDRSCAALMDSESRWALESCTASAAAAALALQKQKRRSIESPHHPERSLSFSSHNNTNINNNNNNAAARYNRSNNNSPTTTTTTSTTRGQLQRSSMPTRVTPKRATRLTRMAERAKAVARTPVARRKSFQRHSLPSGSHSSSAVVARRPIGRKSSSLGSGRRSSLSSPRSLCVDCSVHSQSHCSSSSLSPSKSAMIPRRRNSIQCILPRASSRTRDGGGGGGGGVLCPTRSTGRGLEAMILRQRASLRGSGTAAAASAAAVRRSTTGCFQLSCAAANTNRPPRLPQRHPSEATPQIPASN